MKKLMILGAMVALGLVSCKKDAVPAEPAQDTVTTPPPPPPVAPEASDNDNTSVSVDSAGVSVSNTNGDNKADVNLSREGAKVEVKK